METVRSVLELAYFASGPLILIVACIGLYQLKITKETARLNAQRDSLRLTADQCEYYQSQIIPLQSTLDKTIKEKGISFFQKAEIDIHEEAIRIRMNLEADELKTELNKIQAISKELVAVYNAMEAFALFFVSGVADERVAFSAVGKTYCYSIRKYLPDLFPVSATQGSTRMSQSCF